MAPPATIAEVARTTPVVDATDVLVVGGGPAGVSAAVAAARSGARVTLVERYPYLGGLASGGMVLVLDDMVNGAEITTTGMSAQVGFFSCSSRKVPTLMQREENMGTPCKLC